MSAYSVLYYPGFYPNAVWLRRILLLTDDVVRIVPTDVQTEDSTDLLSLREAIPECLRSIPPTTSDAQIESHAMPRLAKAFRLLAKSRAGSQNKIRIDISGSGTISVDGHVFLHHDKVSPVIYEELQRNKLIINGIEKHLGSGEFLVVDKDASDLILSSLAERMSRRIGLDTITDKPIPFALNSLNNLGVTERESHDRAEGILLCSLASILVPLEIATLDPRDYRNLRNAYSSIRMTFKGLTTELVQINRLNRIQDSFVLRDRVRATADAFFREYREFRKSRYAKGFKRWAPLCVGGLLSVIAKAVAHPKMALSMAGASFAIQIVQKKLEPPSGQPGHERIFNMLAGIRKDIVRRSGIKQII